MIITREAVRAVAFEALLWAMSPIIVGAMAVGLSYLVTCVFLGPIVIPWSIAQEKGIPFIQAFILYHLAVMAVIGPGVFIGLKLDIEYSDDLNPMTRTCILLFVGGFLVACFT